MWRPNHGLKATWGVNCIAVFEYLDEGRQRIDYRLERWVREDRHELIYLVRYGWTTWGGKTSDVVLHETFGPAETERFLYRVMHDFESVLLELAL